MAYEEENLKSGKQYSPSTRYKNKYALTFLVRFPHNPNLNYVCSYFILSLYTNSHHEKNEAVRKLYA